MKEIKKTKQFTTESGTKMIFKCVVSRGWELVEKEMWADEPIKISSKEPISVNRLSIDVDGLHFDGTFTINSESKRKATGVFASFGGKPQGGQFLMVGLSEQNYNMLKAIVDDAVKEAEQDSDWKEYVEKCKADEAEQEEYDKSREEMKRIMGY